MNILLMIFKLYYILLIATVAPSKKKYVGQTFTTNTHPQVRMQEVCLNMIVLTYNILSKTNVLH